MAYRRSGKRRKHLMATIEGLEGRLQELVSIQPQTRAALAPVPVISAIYLFSEKRRPIYTGRTRNLRRRLADHMNPGNDRYSATFAFRLAKEDALGTKLDLSVPNAELERQPAFRKLFLSAKERVSAMGVQFVEIRDPIEQTLVEVYVAESLATPYNDFETH